MVQSPLELRPSQLMCVAALILGDFHETKAEAFVDQKLHEAPDNASRVVLLDEIGFFFRHGHGYHQPRQG